MEVQLGGQLESNLDCICVTHKQYVSVNLLKRAMSFSQFLDFSAYANTV